MGEETTDPPLLTLRDGLPPVIDTEAALAEYCALLAAGTGPVAIDAERASGYRYSNRAYLIQVRRDGAGTALIDPIPFASMAPLQEAIGEAEWILHAATQDLPCLAEVGLFPHALFDTELAGRLLDYPRVGLATLVETLLGRRLKKEHSAVDWSTRPLPEPWLEYAALDVEVLVELRAVLVEQLAEAGKSDWARQEFDHLRGFTPPERSEGWRRTSGMHKVRGRRALAAVRELWVARDEIAQEQDVTPGRLIPDSAISAVATAMPTSRRTLLDTKGFHGRGARRYAATWVAALQRASEMTDEELPTRAPRGDGPPAPRAWADKDPVAARRLELARAAVKKLSEEHQVPPENLLTPDHLRRVMWAPPRTREPVSLLEEVIDRLGQLGSRGWQVGLTGQALAHAVLQADAEAAARATTAETAQEPESSEEPSSSDSSSEPSDSSSDGS
ncbi:ribonuclease D [Nocardioides panacisoli]|uniref:ribonuclease D n=1 Tax=Nocardioides panacisoli TaxID=627624 RepID=UPI001C635B46|nr:ribonuclease D [Nocardioides panacisoli]QYJ03990.1 ribonuclease D [Nocardioides panacisoli]